MGSVWGVAEDLVTPGMPTKKTPAPRTHKFKPAVFQNVVSGPAKSVLPANMLERRILPPPLSTKLAGLETLGMRPSLLCFNKPSWSLLCTLKFKNYWFTFVFCQLFFSL